jgi:hypothetical protein
MSRDQWAQTADPKGPRGARVLLCGHELSPLSEISIFQFPISKRFLNQQKAIWRVQLAQDTGPEGSEIKDESKKNQETQRTEIVRGAHTMPRSIATTIATPACARCKRLKVKCPGPPDKCARCVKADVICRASSDGRSVRASNAYVQSLEERVRTLERQLTRLAHATATATISATTTATAGAGANASAKNNRSRGYVASSQFRMMYDERSARENFGSSSIFHSLQLPPPRRVEDALDVAAVTSVRELNCNVAIVDCIKAFFQWSYPDLHMFLPRETFLIDFFNGGGGYCSVELVYAVCCVGSLFKENASTNESDRYYSLARQRLFTSLGKPSITAIQGFLLLGVADLHRADLNACWLHVGMGLRIGFNIGFHLAPDYKVHRVSKLFKSRIYWGCFILDHFVSTVMGRTRTTMLRVDESTIEESGKVPDLEWIAEFNPQTMGNRIIDVSTPLKSIVKLIAMTSATDNTGISVVRAALNWREQLPAELQWTTEDLRLRAATPPESVHVFYFYTVVLAATREQITTTSTTTTTMTNSILHEMAVVASDCVDAVAAALDAFTAHHSAARLSILPLYCGMLAADVHRHMNSTAHTTLVPSPTSLPPLQPMRQPLPSSLTSLLSILAAAGTTLARDVAQHMNAKSVPTTNSGTSPASGPSSVSPSSSVMLDDASLSLALETLFGGAGAAGGAGVGADVGGAFDFPFSFSF